MKLTLLSVLAVACTSLVAANSSTPKVEKRSDSGFDNKDYNGDMGNMDDKKDFGYDNNNNLLGNRYGHSNNGFGRYGGDGLVSPFGYGRNFGGYRRNNDDYYKLILSGELDNNRFGGYGHSPLNGLLGGHEYSPLNNLFGRHGYGPLNSLLGGNEYGSPFGGYGKHNRFNNDIDYFKLILSGDLDNKYGSGYNGYFRKRGLEDNKDKNNKYVGFNKENNGEVNEQLDQIIELLCKILKVGLNYDDNDIDYKLILGGSDSSHGFFDKRGDNNNDSANGVLGSNHDNNNNNNNDVENRLEKIVFLLSKILKEAINNNHNDDHNGFSPFDNDSFGRKGNGFYNGGFGYPYY